MTTARAKVSGSVSVHTTSAAVRLATAFGAFGPPGREPISDHEVLALSEQVLIDAIVIDAKKLALRCRRLLVLALVRRLPVNRGRPLDEADDSERAAGT